MCPKCGSLNFFYTKYTREFDGEGNIYYRKRYFCLDCGCEYDYV
jgi:phage FluMu protein Com